jgi:hypothetical protein
MRTRINTCLAVALAAAAVALPSCDAQRAEQQLAGEAGQLCGISPARICISAGNKKMVEDYIVSLDAEGGPKRTNDLRCLAAFAKKKGYFLQMAPVARCRTGDELDIADAGSAACAVEVQQLWVNTQQISAGRSFTLISRTQPGGSDEEDACLDQWAKGRGYGYLPYLRTD